MSKHPVDALKELGAEIDPDVERQLREICDAGMSVADVAILANDAVVIKGFIERLGEVRPVEWGVGPFGGTLQ